MSDSILEFKAFNWLVIKFRSCLQIWLEPFGKFNTLFLIKVSYKYPAQFRLG